MNWSIFSRFRGFKVYAGFSGGADSTAVLLAALAAKNEYALSVTAVHFNHHLRGDESDAEALAAKEFALSHGADFICYDLELPPGGNMEARARSARLEKFRELAGGDQQAVVLLGHHAGDRRENLFLRLLRGGNSSSLAGLRRESIVNGVHFCRILYDWEREDIESFLRANGVEKWAEDSSNLKDDYDRNFIRNRVLPLLSERFPRSRAALNTSLENLECDASFIEEYAAEMYNSGDASSTDFWKGLHPALVCRILRMFLDECFGKMPPPSSQSVKRFAAAVNGRGNISVELDNSRVLRISGNRIYPQQDTPQKILWRWKNEPEIFWGKWHFTCRKLSEMPENITPYAACFDMDTLPDVLEISAAAEGEKMVPFGRSKGVKIKQLRIDRKMPAYPVPPVVREAGGMALWLPGVRHSAHFAASDDHGIVMFSGEFSEEF